MIVEPNFYESNDRSTFFLKSRTVCGKSLRVNILDSSMFKSEDIKFKFMQIIYLLSLLNKNDESKERTCSWIGPVFNYTGYSNMNRNIVKNLMDKNMGVRISRKLDYYDCFLSEIEPILKRSISHSKSTDPVIWAQVTSAPEVLNGKCKSVHFTMSEFEGKYNYKFIKTLSKNDEIWVPTEWDKNKLIDSGLEKPICNFNLGVDSEIFYPHKVEDVIYSSGVNSFRFVSVMSWNWRKGYDVLIKAYCRKFSSKDDVSLVLFSRESISKDSYRILSEMTSEYGDECPHIILCQAIIPTYAMANIYNNSHAYVSFSRGEGWGLPLMEASSCDIPIITSFQGGQKAFLKKEDSYLVEPDLLVPVNKEMLSWSDIYDGTYFVDYSEKVIDEASNKMRYVYENYNEAKKLAKICGSRIRAGFDWKITSNKMYNRIVELS